MLYPTWDVPLLPQRNALVMAYQHEAADWLRESSPHGLLVARYEAGNALTTAPHKREPRKDPLSDYQPRTELGKRLLALRLAYIASGGQLLSAKALDEELRARRGGVDDA